MSEEEKHGPRPPGGGHTVSILVDNVKHEVRPGTWIVRDLKAEVKVDPAKVLAEIKPHGLVDLDDDGKIAVHEGQRFMSHVRSGGSS